jgi:fatty-acyl-CoA synthase
MFHCNGWCFVWAVTAIGGRHVCLSNVDSGRVLRLIADERVSHFCAAPVVLNGLVSHPDAVAVRYSHRVRVATGGSPPSPTTIAKVRSMGMELTHLYGLTETYGPSLLCEPQSSWSAYDDEKLAATMARQGVRTVTVEQVRVVDSDMSDVPRDGATVGQIVFRSNTVMAGYLDDEVATKAAFTDGWLLTGDLAVVHPDGYLEIHDRAKDVIITGGENVSSVEVENVLMSAPGVLEAAVVGRSDEKWGEVPVAFVTLVDEATVTPEQLVSHVRSRLAHFKAPKEIIFTTLPKTSTGKIRKSVLRDRARGTTDA